MSAVLESWLPRHRFNADDLERLYEFGILGPGDRIALIEGKILNSMAAMAGAYSTVIRRESKAMDAVPDSWVPYRRFRSADYYRMWEIGLFAPDARIELIEGEIIDMAPIGSPHCGTVDWLNEVLVAALRKHVIVRPQSVIELSDFSHPQPDIALLQRRKDFYRSAHPGPPETFLIIEVSASSLRLDEMVKVPLFAHFEIPEMWIVDLVHERLNVYRSPRDGEYTEVSSIEKPGVTALSALPGVTVDLSDLFG
jgi:Uma2 family endonuclease